MNYNQNRTILGGNTNTIVTSVVNLGVSSLSSIVSYGLSTVAAGAINPGVSSLSSIVSYGLSSIVGSGGGSITTTNNITVRAALEVFGTTKLHNDTTVDTVLIVGGGNNTTKIVVGSPREFGIDGLSLFINYTNATSNITQRNYNSIGWLDVAFNGSMWVAVGFGDGSNASSVVAYSYNGANWSNGNLAAFDFNNYYYQTPGLFSVEYGNNLWTAVGWNNGSNIFFSLDGINWTPNSNFPGFFPPLYSVAYNSNTNLWVYGAQEIFGPNVTLLTTNDPTGSNIEVAAIGGFDTVCVYAVPNPATNSWIAVGQDISNNNCIQYSSDGSNWYPAYNLTTGSNSFFNSGFGIGFGAAYGNGRWLVTGIDNNGNSIYSSADGSNFSLIANLSNVMIDIQYGGGSTFYATAFNITNIFGNSLNSDLYLLKSEDNGYTWASNILYYNNSNYNFTLARLAVQLGTNNAASVTIADGSITTTSNITVGGSGQITHNLTVGSNILVSGYIGINCNTPSYSLDIAGTAHVAGYTRLDGQQTIVNYNQLVIFSANSPSCNGGVYYYKNSNIYTASNPYTDNDVYYNGSLWVAAGTTCSSVQVSTDGSNWSNITVQSNYSFTGYTVTYQDNLWVLAGESYDGPSLFTSPDGYNWTGNLSTSNYTGKYTSIKYNGSYWLITGNPSIYYTTDPRGSDFTLVGGFSYVCEYAAWSSDAGLWVAVGSTSYNYNIQYSSDGSNWYVASNTTFGTNTFFSSGGYGIAYGNGRWIAVGDDANQTSNTMYTSTDGSNFTLLNSNYESVLDVQYLSGSSWVSMISWATPDGYSNVFLLSSNDGVSWVAQDLRNIIGDPYAGNRVNRIEVYNSQYITYVQNNTSLVLDVYGQTHLTGDVLATGTTTLSNTVIVGSNWVYTSKNETQFIAFASANSYSNIGVYFYNQSNHIITPTGNSNYTYDVCYNGSLWVAVGPNSGVIQTSTDGSNWSNVTMTTDNFTGYGVTYANNLWVVAGQNYSAGTGVFTSSDGNIWTPNYNFYADTDNYYFKPVYNSTDDYWLIPRLLYSGNNRVYSIYYSVDPTSSINSRVGNFDSSCRGLCWNGSNLWVAVGTSINGAENIQYSSDGSNWNAASNLTNSTNNFFNFANLPYTGIGGYGVAYGADVGIWLVVGQDAYGQPYNTIYSSTDGSNFSLVNSNYTGFYDIKYLGGSNWVATYNTYTEVALTNGLIWSSDNGSNWSNIPLTDYPFLIHVYNPIQTTSNLVGISSNLLALNVYGQTHLTGDVFAAGTTTLSNTKSNIIVQSNWLYTSNYVQRVAFASDIFASNTGVYLYNQNNQTITPTGNSNYIEYDIFYNGSLWIAVGPGSGVIQTSVDGSNWSNVTMTADNFTGYGVTYANNLWVVSGTGSYPDNPGIYTSPDGNVWTPNSNYHSDGGCNYYFKAVYNSTDNYWLIPAAYSYGVAAPIYYTTDPTGSDLTPITPFDTVCRAVCWNGSLWVAVGLSMDGNYNIQYSSDGLNWSSANNVTNGGNQFFVDNANSITGGYGVAYGSNGVWLVVGDDGGGFNTIYSSPNGIDFSIINSSYEGFRDIKYLGGSSWVATYNTSHSGASNGFIISSDNGSNWSNISLSDPPYGIDVSNFLQVSSNLVITSNVIHDLALNVYGNTNLHGDLTVSGNVSMSNLGITNLETINLVAYSITTLDLITNSIVNNNITTSDILTNAIGTSNLTASNITTNYLAATNIGATNLAATNVVAADLLATNLVANDIGTSNLVASNITTTDLVATNQITASNLITNLLSLIDQTQGSNQLLYATTNLLYFNNFIIAGSRQFQPQFITFGTPSTVPVVASISFNQANDGDPTTVTFTGEIVNNGGQPITEMGVVYAGHSEPTLSVFDNKYMYDPTIQSGTFSIGPDINFGTLDTHIRTYAINSIGVSYGTDLFLYIT